MRTLLITLLAVSAAAALAGCSPEDVGDVGVGVNAQGDPVLVMASCEGPADRIEISSASAAEPGPEGRNWATERELENPEPSYADPAAVSLAEPDPRWEDDGGRPVGFEDDRIYRVRALPEGAGTLGSVSFEMADLAGLEPGEVLSDRGIASVSEFIDRAHEACG
ncbi:hypothetical protein [Glycomyces tenuis]|uniref:hypothetical protein n=1 Tax=Glycomyces tenuis TaxID=58116 RepID=UPI00041D78FF|nr:hypothetical protein [Glycomyces tenuis]